MAEVDEPALQRKVLRLAVAAARADRHLADGEALVLAAARRHWGLGEEAEAGSPFAGAPAGGVSESAQARAAAMTCSTSG